MYRRVSLILFLLVLLTGCAQGLADIQPPEIRFGEDQCAECNMIIGDPRFAAAYAHEIAEGRYMSVAFDDIGDMLVHAEKHPDHSIVGWYVHDYTSQEWINAEEAHFVMNVAIRSPMGYGIAAHADAVDAAAMAASFNATVLDWATLSAHPPVSDHLHDGHADDH